MLPLCILLFAILLLSLAISQWLADTMISGVLLRHISGTVIASVIMSVLFDIALATALPFMWFIFLSIITSAVYLFLQWRKKLALVNTPPFLPDLTPTLYSIIVLVLTCYLSWLFIPHSGRWGRWDARAIWTLHAKFMFYQGQWGNMFSPQIGWTHADYPLMLSSLVAMFWRVMNIPEPLVPCLIAYIVFVLIILGIYTGLRTKNNPLLGILGILALVFTPIFSKISAYQGADSLLSLFILLSFVSARQEDNKPDPKLLFVTGFIAGFAGWIKNEGIAFTLIFSLGILWQYRKSLKTLMPYIGGLLLPLTIIIIFKTVYAPSNDIVHGQSHNTLSQLTDLARYKLTIKFFANNLRKLYPVLLIIATLIAIRGYKRLGDPYLLILLAMLAAYFFIFIITPRDLQWHLETASERLFMQLFPAFVYVLLSLLSKEQSTISTHR